MWVVNLPSLLTGEPKIKFKKIFYSVKLSEHRRYFVTQIRLLNQKYWTVSVCTDGVAQLCTVASVHILLCSTSRTVVGDIWCLTSFCNPVFWWNIKHFSCLEYASVQTCIHPPLFLTCNTSISSKACSQSFNTNWSYFFFTHSDGVCMNWQPLNHPPEVYRLF